MSSALETTARGTPDKVHLDVQLTRYRADNSAIGSYRSLWIVSKLDGRWARNAAPVSPIRTGHPPATLKSSRPGLAV